MTSVDGCHVTMKIKVLIGLLLSLKVAGALQVTIPQKAYEFATGDNITLPCTFKPKTPRNPLVIVTWTAEADRPGTPESLVLIYFSSPGTLDVKQKYEGRVKLDHDIATGKINLKLMSITPADNRMFECRVQIPGDDVGKLAATTRLIVWDPPDVPLVSMDPPGEVVEGRNLTLTCSSAANPPVHSYTWYKRTTGPPGCSSMVQVGSGQVLVLASVKPCQSGLYFCHTRNSVGENNSTEVLLQVNTTDIDGLILRVVMGVKVLAVLLFAVVMLWLWKQDSGMDKAESPHNVNISGSVGYRRGFISSAHQDNRPVEEQSNM